MSHFFEELKLKFKAPLLALRDLGHKITGNDELIEQYNNIIMTLARAADEAEKDYSRKAILLNALYKLEDSSSIEHGSCFYEASYNPYRATRSENKKRVEYGYRILNSLGLVLNKQSRKR